MTLKNKVALITGAGSGIGKETAILLGENGAKIIVNDINLKKAKEVINIIKDNGGEGLAITADVSDKKAVENMIESVINKFNRLDILVNNAGIFETNDIQSVSEESWDRIMNVKLKGAFLCSKKVIDHMIKREEGKIINISSISGLTARSVGVNYSAANSGLLGLTRTLALQVAKYGINVNAIAPGPVYTRLWEDVLTENSFDEMVKTVPFSKNGKPIDIAKTVLFLAEEADWITGEVISVNGGAFMG